MTNRMLIAVLALSLYLLPWGTASAEKGWSVHQDANTIYSMAASGSVVWCATSGGLLRLHPDTGVIDRFNDSTNPSSLIFTKLTFAPDGILWGLSSGVLFWIDSASPAKSGLLTMNDVHEAGGVGAPPRGTVTDFAVGLDNTLWAGTTDGLYHLTGNIWERTNFEYSKVTSVVVDGIGRIWAGCDTVGGTGVRSMVYLNDGAGWSAFTDFGYSYIPSLALAAWKEDIIFAWRHQEANRPDYLFYIHGKEMNVIPPEDTPAGSFTAFCSGPDGSAWLGTDKGLYQIEIDPTFSFKKYSLSDGLPNNNVLSIVSTGDGKLIAGTNIGFGIFDKTTWSSLRVSGPIGFKISQSVQAPDGDMWFGSEKGISRFHGGSWETYTEKDGLRENAITKLWLDSNGRISYSSASGFGSFENGTWNSSYTPMYPIDSIESPDGTVWWLKNEGGERVLYHIVGSEYTKVASYGNRTITDFKVAPDSSVWVCSTAWFKRYKNGICTDYPYKDGAPSSHIIIGPRNEIWCNPGWTGLSKLEGDTFRTFSFPGQLPVEMSWVFFDPFSNLWVISRFGETVRYDGEQLYRYNPLEGYVRNMTIDDRGRLFQASSDRIAWFEKNSWNSIPNPTGLIPNGCFAVNPYIGEIWLACGGALVQYVGDDVPVEQSARPITNIICENFPNPFNPSTVISYTIPQSGQVTVTMYNAAGQKIAEIARGFRSAGTHSVTWNAQGCASGVYFCSVRAGKATETRKMLLMR